MKQKLRMFAIHQIAPTLQWVDNLNPRTIWYMVLDESNWVKSAYFTIHPSKIPPPQNGCPLNYDFFLKKHRVHILHFPNSTRLFTKPTGRHYTKYGFSPDIAKKILNCLVRWIGHQSIGVQVLRYKFWSSIDYPIHTERAFRDFG